MTVCTFSKSFLVFCFDLKKSLLATRGINRHPAAPLLMR